MFSSKASAKKTKARSKPLQSDSEDQVPIDGPNGHTSDNKPTRTEEVQLTEVSLENNATNASRAREDNKEGVCPLAESEKSSVVELEMGKITEDIKGTENPAFLSEETETQPG